MTNHNPTLRFELHVLAAQAALMACLALAGQARADEIQVPPFDDPLQACGSGSVYLLQPKVNSAGEIMPDAGTSRAGFICTGSGKHQYAVIGFQPADTYLEAIAEVAREAMEMLVSPAAAGDGRGGLGGCGCGNQSTSGAKAGGGDSSFNRSVSYGGWGGYGGCGCTVGPGGMLGHI